MLDWLKQLFSPRKEPEVEYDQAAPDDSTVVRAGPPTIAPPAVPVEKPVPEESDRQR